MSKKRPAPSAKQITEKLNEAEKKLNYASDTRPTGNKAPRFRIEKKTEAETRVIPDANNRDEFYSSMHTAIGTTSLDMQEKIVRELAESYCGNSHACNEQDINSGLAAMYGIAPRDEAEGMLVTQMVATHTAAMRVLRQLKNSESIPQQDSNGNLATKLLRTYTAQVEALSRYRSKGQQKMTVEHVHIHPGAQAVVGDVIRSEGKTMPSNSAKHIDYAPNPTMPILHTEKRPVTVHQE